MEQAGGYDYHADIWCAPRAAGPSRCGSHPSRACRRARPRLFGDPLLTPAPSHRSLGITLLELAHGHAPFAKYPPMKVLMMTLQNPPPTVRPPHQQLSHPPPPSLPPPLRLPPRPHASPRNSPPTPPNFQLEADTGDKHFSRALRELVALCLQKDPNKRPTAAKLLEHRFIKEAKKPDYIVKHLLEGLPTLPERVRLLRDRESKKPSDQNEAQSQIECATPRPSPRRAQPRPAPSCGGCVAVLCASVRG